jgi:hypothetical protein
MLYGKVDEEKNRDRSDTSGGGEISSKQQWDSKNTWSVPLESHLSSTFVIHAEPLYLRISGVRLVDCIAYTILDSTTCPSASWILPVRTNDSVLRRRLHLTACLQGFWRRLSNSTSDQSRRVD